MSNVNKNVEIYKKYGFIVRSILIFMILIKFLITIFTSSEEFFLIGIPIAFGSVYYLANTFENKKTNTIDVVLIIVFFDFMLSLSNILLFFSIIPYVVFIILGLIDSHYRKLLEDNKKFKYTMP